MFRFETADRTNTWTGRRPSSTEAPELGREPARKDLVAEGEQPPDDFPAFLKGQVVFMEMDLTAAAK